MSKSKSTTEKIADILLFAILLYIILCIWSFILKEFVIPIKNGNWTNVIIWVVSFIVAWFIVKMF